SKYIADKLSFLKGYARNIFVAMIEFPVMLFTTPKFFAALHYYGFWELFLKKITFKFDSFIAENLDADESFRQRLKGAKFIWGWTIAAGLLSFAAAFAPFIAVSWQIWTLFAAANILSHAFYNFKHPQAPLELDFFSPDQFLLKPAVFKSYFEKLKTDDKKRYRQARRLLSEILYQKPSLDIDFNSINTLFNNEIFSFEHIRNDYAKYDAPTKEFIIKTIMDARVVDETAAAADKSTDFSLQESFYEGREESSQDEIPYGFPLEVRQIGRSYIAVYDDNLIISITRRQYESYINILNNLEKYFDKNSAAMYPATAAPAALTYNSKAAAAALKKVELAAAEAINRQQTLYLSEIGGIYLSLGQYQTANGNAVLNAVFYKNAGKREEAGKVTVEYNPQKYKTKLKKFVSKTKAAFNVLAKAHRFQSKLRIFSNLLSQLKEIDADSYNKVLTLIQAAAAGTGAYETKDNFEEETVLMLLTDESYFDILNKKNIAGAAKGQYGGRIQKILEKMIESAQKGETDVTAQSIINVLDARTNAEFLRDSLRTINLTHKSVDLPEAGGLRLLFYNDGYNFNAIFYKSRHSNIIIENVQVPNFSSQNFSIFIKKVMGIYAFKVRNTQKNLELETSKILADNFGLVSDETGVKGFILKCLRAGFVSLIEVHKTLAGARAFTNMHYPLLTQEIIESGAYKSRLAGARAIIGLSITGIAASAGFASFLAFPFLAILGTGILGGLIFNILTHTIYNIVNPGKELKMRKDDNLHYDLRNSRIIVDYETPITVVTEKGYAVIEKSSPYRITLNGQTTAYKFNYMQEVILDLDGDFVLGTGSKEEHVKIYIRPDGKIDIRNLREAPAEVSWRSSRTNGKMIVGDFETKAKENAVLKLLSQLRDKNPNAYYYILFRVGSISNEFYVTINMLLKLHENLSAAARRLSANNDFEGDTENEILDKILGIDRSSNVINLFTGAADNSRESVKDLLEELAKDPKRFYDFVLSLVQYPIEERRYEYPDSADKEFAAKIVQERSIYINNAKIMKRYRVFDSPQALAVLDAIIGESASDSAGLKRAGMLYRLSADEFVEFPNSITIEGSDAVALNVEMAKFAVYPTKVYHRSASVPASRKTEVSKNSAYVIIQRNVSDFQELNDGDEFILASDSDKFKIGDSREHTKYLSFKVEKNPRGSGSQMKITQFGTSIGTYVSDAATAQMFPLTSDSAREAFGKYLTGMIGKFILEVFIAPFYEQRRGAFISKADIQEYENELPAKLKERYNGAGKDDNIIFGLADIKEAEALNKDLAEKLKDKFLMAHRSYREASANAKEGLKNKLEKVLSARLPFINAIKALSNLAVLIAHFRANYGAYAFENIKSAEGAVEGAEDKILTDSKDIILSGSNYAPENIKSAEGAAEGAVVEEILSDSGNQDLISHLLDYPQDIIASNIVESSYKIPEIYRLNSDIAVKLVRMLKESRELKESAKFLQWLENKGKSAGNKYFFSEEDRDNENFSKYFNLPKEMDKIGDEIKPDKLKIKILKKFHFIQRDIVEIELPGKKRMLFYKSAHGTSEKEQGVWYPLQGIVGADGFLGAPKY
ncbi:MAG: hypothetical protein LBQ47_05135, partial [Endomicrobium sp.]|nr:hypothetical protein [Endomicrobium sp.]